MTDLPDPNIFTPPPAEEPSPEFDIAKALRSVSEPISIGPHFFQDDIFDDLTKEVTVPTVFAEPITQEVKVAFDLTAYPSDKPRYDNIRARLF